MRWATACAALLIFAACSISRTSTKFYEPGAARPAVECDKTVVDWKPEVISLPLGAGLAYVGADWISVLAVTFPSAFSKLLTLPVTAVDNITTAPAAKECGR